AARRREIARLIKLQTETTKKGTVEWKRYRNAIADQRKAINALIGEQRKNLNAQAEFSFLQMQTGFVANLLGNLIPGGLTGGLVGGGGGPAGNAPMLPPPTVPGLKDPGQKPRTTADLKNQGPTRIGQSSTNHLLERILRTLVSIERGNQHPEA